MAISGRLKLAGLHPNVREAAEWALAWAAYYDVPVTVTSGFRSWQDQERLYQNYQGCLARGLMGKTPECKWPANRPGDSSHNFGLSFDSVTESWAQEWWNRVRELAGFRVPANDVIHAEVPDWRRYV